MSFDPAVIRVDNVALGNFLGSTGRNTAPLGPEVDNDAGTMRFGAFSFGSQPGTSGDGVLAIITLTAQGTANSPLALALLRGDFGEGDTIVADVAGEQLAFRKRVEAEVV